MLTPQLGGDVGGGRSHHDHDHSPHCIAPGVEMWTQWQMYISLAHMSAGVQSVCYYKFLSVCRLSFKFLLDLQFSKKHSHVIVKWVKYLRQKLSNVSAPIFPKYFFNITICPSWQQLKLLSKPLAFLHANKICGGCELYCVKCLFLVHMSHISEEQTISTLLSTVSRV